MESLITGISGFIGSNLAINLVEKKISVVGLDKKIGNRVRYLMIENDIRNINGYHYIMKNVDRIYHLAASCDIKKSKEDTTWDLENNVVGTHCILEMMRKLDIKELIFPSTSALYGENAKRPTKEEAPLTPISQYSASKIAAEKFIETYCHLYGLKAWVFRFGNVVGKYQHRGVIVDFINKLYNGPKELEILGDGKQIKSYVHVSDCISAMNFIPEHDNNDGFQVYNIATTDYCNVREVADIVSKGLGVKPKYHFTGGDRGWEGDIPKIELSIEKALKVGWKPKYDCKQAISKAVEELK